jgi:glycosyltransferase involved in cell wall biosynthesis
MRIGYLHLGTSIHGINRYGRLLAQESHKRSNLTVIEAEVMLTGDRSKNLKMLACAAQQLSQADVVHIQFSYFNDQLWGAGWAQLDHLKAFLKNCSSPVIVTLHDVYYSSNRIQEVLKQTLFQLKSKFSRFKTNQEEAPPTPLSRQIARPAKVWWINTFGAATATLKELTKHADLVLVCSHEEARRVRNRVNPKKLKIIPHFVENRTISTTYSEARKYLNLTDKKVVTILGFIFPSKGHQLLIESIPYLPSDVQIIFAGSTDTAKEHSNILKKLAHEKGVQHRLKFTGYLSEQQLEFYLKATDLAICAFKNFSASGSISTWISVERPILAFNLPQIMEYNKIEKDAIQIFEPYSPKALATAIQNFLRQDPKDQARKIESLKQKISLSNILDKHLDLYELARDSHVISTFKS